MHKHFYKQSRMHTYSHASMHTIIFTYIHWSLHMPLGLETYPCSAFTHAYTPADIHVYMNHACKHTWLYQNMTEHKVTSKQNMTWHDTPKQTLPGSKKYPSRGIFWLTSYLSHRYIHIQANKLDAYINTHIHIPHTVIYVYMYLCKYIA